MSSTMLAEEVDLEDIENHETFRDSMRQILGLHRSTENNSIGKLQDNHKFHFYHLQSYEWCKEVRLKMLRRFSWIFHGILITFSKQTKSS